MVSSYPLLFSKLEREVNNVKTTHNQYSLESNADKSALSFLIRYQIRLIARNYHRKYPFIFFPCLPIVSHQIYSYLDLAYSIHKSELYTSKFDNFSLKYHAHTFITSRYPRMLVYVFIVYGTRTIKFTKTSIGTTASAVISEQFDLLHVRVKSSGNKSKLNDGPCRNGCDKAGGQRIGLFIRPLGEGYARREG